MLEELIEKSVAFQQLSKVQCLVLDSSSAASFSVPRG